MYEHVGQHGEGSPRIVDDTTPASKEEYAPLLAELQDRGYRLIVRKRIQWKGRIGE